MNQKVFLGDSSIENLNKVLSLYEGKNVFLVRGKKSYELCGARALLEKLMNFYSFDLQEFYDFSENPRIEDVERGLFLLNNKSYDLIVAVGGGSVLDMAKLLRFFYSYGDRETLILGTQKYRELIPLITVPTTAGTGSEVTHFAVLYKNKIKYSIAHKDLLSDIAIIYPPFTYSNSAYLTACAGFDALAQAIESYWNVNSTFLSDEYALRAINLIWSNLPKAVCAPTEQIRKYLSEGAYWAGMAINITKTSAPHAMSYSFTSHYNIPHGHAVALSFPFFMEFNCNLTNIELQSSLSFEYYKEKIDILFQYLNYKRDISINHFMFDYISSLGLSFNLPINFSDDIIINNVNIQRLNNNPRIVRIQDICVALEDIKSKNR